MPPLRRGALSGGSVIHHEGLFRAAGSFETSGEIIIHLVIPQTRRHVIAASSMGHVHRASRIVLGEIVAICTTSPQIACLPRPTEGYEMKSIPLTARTATPLGG